MVPPGPSASPSELFESKASGIVTTGDSAHGIFAQSIGGGGTGTTTATMVSVSANADVTVSGPGAHGIYAQSAGDGMGAIAITVGPGVRVQGGGLASDGGSDDGAGIFIQNGTQATLSNAGTITSVLGTAGTAIRVVDTTANIVNAGTITGQIVKASSIDLLNRPGGLINAGSADRCRQPDQPRDARRLGLGVDRHAPG